MTLLARTMPTACRAAASLFKIQHHRIRANSCAARAPNFLPFVEEGEVMPFFPSPHAGERVPEGRVRGRDEREGLARLIGGPLTSTLSLG